MSRRNQEKRIHNRQRKASQRHHQQPSGIRILKWVTAAGGAATAIVKFISAMKDLR